MTPEQFLNKWLPQAAEWLNVHPESLRMKDDLEAVIRAFNDEAGRCIIEENIGHIDNWGEEMIRRYKKDGSFAESDFEEAIERMAKHHEDGHIEASPFCFPSPVKYGNDFGIKRPDKPLIVDCDYPPETLTRKSYSISGSINKTTEVPEDKFDSLLEALKKCPDKRVEL